MKNIFIISSIALFLVSLTQKCYITDFTNDKGISSLLALLTGWLGVIMCHGPAISWLANPFLIISWVLFLTNSKYALLVSLVTLCFMVSFLFLKKILVNEAGHYGTIIRYESGYWLWLASAVVMITGTIYTKYCDA